MKDEYHNSYTEMHIPDENRPEYGTEGLPTYEQVYGKPRPRTRTILWAIVAILIIAAFWCVCIWWIFC